MVGEVRRDKESARRKRFSEGLPGHHDPIAGIGGASPAYSALTLRLCLAVLGFLTCTALAIWTYALDVPIGFVAALVVLAAAGVVDIAVIVRRKRRGEPG